jgi:folylpolyglutamate synthase/dihydropteroate synthase
VCDLAKKDPRMLPQETLKMQIETITKREVFLVEDPFKQAYLEKDEKNLLLVCGGFQMVKEAKKRFKDFPYR